MVENGVHLGVLTRGLLQLLDSHGADALAQAIDAALGENATPYDPAFTDYFARRAQSRRVNRLRWPNMGASA